MTMTEPETVETEPTQNIPEPAAEVTTPEVAEPEGDKPEAPEDERDKTLRRMERRINQKHAQAAAMSERARAAEERAQAYEQRLQQYEAPQQEEPRQLRQEDVLALADRMATEKLEVQRLQSHVQTVLSEGKAIPGFDTACNVVNEEVPFYDQRGKPTPFLQAVLDSDAPAKLLHHLGTNPDLAAELSALSPAQMGRRLGRIEAQLSTKPAPKAVSRAPDPAKPIGATRGGSNLADLPMDEYIQQRKAQGARWAR